MKKFIIILLISLTSLVAFSQDEIKTNQTDSLNNYLKNNDSTLAKISRIYNQFQKTLYQEGNDTFAQHMTGISSKINSLLNESINISIDMSFVPVKESFVAILRAINDFNTLNLWKTEEYYNRLHFAIKSNNKKEKETADEQICDFFRQLEKSKETFLINYKLEIENLKNSLNSGDKK